jgi:hypothetical protein
MRGEKLTKKLHAASIGDVGDGDSDLGAVPSLRQSNHGSRSTLSGNSSEFSWKDDVFLHFEILRAGQHKVRRVDPCHSILEGGLHLASACMIMKALSFEKHTATETPVSVGCPSLVDNSPFYLCSVHRSDSILPIGRGEQCHIQIHVAS